MHHYPLTPLGQREALGGFYFMDDHPITLSFAVKLNALAKATTDPEIDSFA